MAQQPAQNTAQAAPPAASKSSLKAMQEETINQVLEKISAFQDAGELMLPQNYSPANALRAAWFILLETVDKDKRPVLEVCTKASIANSLFEMVMKGLSPVKKQCYFVAYGNELSCDESYFGDMAIAKRTAGVKEFYPYAVYEGDEFVYEINTITGRTTIKKHEQSIQNKDHEKVIGSYVIIEKVDGTFDAEVMSMKQVRQSWMQGAARGQSPAHKNFTDEMAMKTVIGRACKRLTNSTDDSDLFRGISKEDRPALQVAKEIGQGANKTAISMGTPPATGQKTISIHAKSELVPETPPAEDASEPETDTATSDKPPF